jgi:hypothetical protein
MKIQPRFHIHQRVVSVPETYIMPFGGFCSSVRGARQVKMSEIGWILSDFDTNFVFR